MAPRTTKGRLARLVRFARREEGSTLVEFALVATVFFTIVFVIIQGGILFGSWIVVTNAAREGARSASPCISRAELVPPVYCDYGDWTSSANIRQTIRNYTRGLIAWPDPADPTFGMSFGASYDPIPVDPATPRLVHVSIDYSVPLLVPLFGIVIPDPVRLTAESDMRIES